MSATVLLGPTPASADSVAKEPLQPVLGTCGALTKNPAIGVVDFRRVKDIVDVNVHLEGAKANAVYTVLLFEPKTLGCTTPLPSVEKKQTLLVTDAKGIGNGIFRFLATGKDVGFLADVTNSDGVTNETPFVTLI
jgi:hypothetical protein